jgi:hypothetical protein
MKKYFVPLLCPWCGQPVGIANQAIEEPAVSCDICPRCLEKLEAIPDHCILVIDETWIAEPIQKADIPIYIFVRGIIVTATPPPPSVPHWKDRYPILPITLAKIAFSVDIIEAIANNDGPPIVINIDFPASLPLMHTGHC